MCFWTDDGVRRPGSDCCWCVGPLRMMALWECVLLVVLLCGDGGGKARQLWRIAQRKLKWASAVNWYMKTGTRYWNLRREVERNTIILITCSIVKNITKRLILLIVTCMNNLSSRQVIINNGLVFDQTRYAKPNKSNRVGTTLFSLGVIFALLRCFSGNQSDLKSISALTWNDGKPRSKWSQTKYINVCVTEYSMSSDHTGCCARWLSSFLDFFFYFVAYMLRSWLFRERNMLLACLWSN
jgi:hypothetical protein